METYTYNLPPSEIASFTRLPYNVRDRSELIKTEYVNGTTELVKSIYSLLTSIQPYKIIFELVDYSNDITYIFEIVKEGNEIVISDPREDEEPTKRFITSDINDDNIRIFSLEDIEYLVNNEIVKDYYTVIKNITTKLIDDKFSTRDIAKKERTKFYSNGTECPLCYKDFDPSISTCITSPCNHVFHCHCLTNWIQTGKDICPMCRTSLTSIETLDPQEIKDLASSSNSFGNSLKSVYKDISYLQGLRC